MGRIERDKDGNLGVAVEGESDAAQLRATIKRADEIAPPSFEGCIASSSQADGCFQQQGLPNHFDT